MPNINLHGTPEPTASKKSESSLVTQLKLLQKKHSAPTHCDSPLSSPSYVSSPLSPIRTVSVTAILLAQQSTPLPPLIEPIPPKKSFFSKLGNLLLKGFEVGVKGAKIVYDILSKSVPVEEFIKGSLRAVKAWGTLKKLDKAIQDISALKGNTEADEDVVKALRFMLEKNKLALKESTLQVLASGAILALELAAFLTTAIGGVAIMVVIGVESTIVTFAEMRRARHKSNGQFDEIKKQNSVRDDLRLKTENALASKDVSPAVYTILKAMGLRGEDGYSAIHDMMR